MKIVVETFSGPAHHPQATGGAIADDGQHGTAPVASFPPNGFGLYDMAGNVWGHLADWYVPGHPALDQTDPEGPPRELAAPLLHPEIGPPRDSPTSSG